VQYRPIGVSYVTSHVPGDAMSRVVYGVTDHISISDFAAGAMENWGLITYRESRLMFDPEFCGQVENEALTVTVAHELVHMVNCYWLPRVT
jgi:aminopeptidase N